MMCASVSRAIFSHGGHLMRFLRELWHRYRPRLPYARQLDRIESIGEVLLGDNATLYRRLRAIMATQAELVVELTAIKGTLDKIGGETADLLTKVDELTTQLANAPVSAEVMAIVDAIKVKAGNIDALVPDAAPPA